MLKGNIKCSDINKYLISYIDYELTKKDMKRIAIHLRNCPKCLEKYTTLYKRKTILEKTLEEIKKRKQMEKEASLYFDNEINCIEKIRIENIINKNPAYKKEIKIYDIISRNLKQGKKTVKEKYRCKNTNKIIAKIKTRRKKRQAILCWFQQLLPEPLKF